MCGVLNQVHGLGKCQSWYKNKARIKSAPRSLQHKKSDYSALTFNTSLSRCVHPPYTAVAPTRTPRCSQTTQRTTRTHPQAEVISNHQLGQVSRTLSLSECQTCHTWENLDIHTGSVRSKTLARSNIPNPFYQATSLIRRMLSFLQTMSYFQTVTEECSHSQSIRPQANTKIYSHDAKTNKRNKTKPSKQDPKSN